MTGHTVLSDSVTLGEALLAGVVMGVYYDVFRIIRRFIHCSYANIVAQDLFFWSTSAVFIFFASIHLYDGVVRVIFVAAALGGWLMYMMTAGTLVMLAADILAKICAKVESGIHNLVAAPLSESVRKRRNARKIKNMNEFDDNL